MKKKRNFHLKISHIFVILTIVCISLLVMTFSSEYSVQPLRDGASYIVVPFEKGINRIGHWIGGFTGSFRDAERLAEENEALRQQVEALTEKNNELSVDQQELARLEELYKVDEEYSEHDKVLAQVIGKEPGNWYTTFTIDKGRRDGIKTDMNVIASGGLVGIVTETGPGWANVRTIIDDGNNVSGMTVSDSHTCIVTGSLQEMDSGRIGFSQMMDTKGSVAVGENIVTSHISDKYLEGILIGTISSIEQDANNLTSAGYLVPAADFRNIQEVLVIKKLKETAKEDPDEK